MPSSVVFTGVVWLRETGVKQEFGPGPRVGIRVKGEVASNGRVSQVEVKSWNVERFDALLTDERTYKAQMRFIHAHTCRTLARQ